MGQCVSRKGAAALERQSAAASPPTLRRAVTMHQSGAASAAAATANVIAGLAQASLRVPRTINQDTDDSKGATRRSSASANRGAAMSFGFKRRPTTAIPLMQDNSKSSTDMDTNGNGMSDGGDLFAVRNSRLPAPKKEAAGANRTNRFGFRQNCIPKITTPTNKVLDSHVLSHTNLENKNNNLDKVRAKQPAPGGGAYKSAPATHRPSVATDNQQQQYKARQVSAAAANLPHAQNAARYKLQYSSLPKAQMPVRLNDKTAKQAANATRKLGEESSSNGSVTEDSGVSSEPPCHGDTDTLHGIEILDSSPTYKKYRRNRQLEMVVSGKHFDVRDLNEDGTVVESSLIPLPKLPSVFQSTPQTHTFLQPDPPQLHYQPRPQPQQQHVQYQPATRGATAGLVKERTLEYQRQLQHNRRKVSNTSSEGFHEDSSEEKMYEDRGHTEKLAHAGVKIANRKTTADISPTSSDDCGGEAMADNYSLSLSSSDEKEQSPVLTARPTNPTVMLASLRSQETSIPTRDVLLTIEDPKFAAVAAASVGHLLEDETSPVDSLISSCTDSEEIVAARQKERSSKMTESNTSKDINEKALQSPGTPTNTSLSLSDGKDFFDDEIADQPSLMAFDADMPTSENTTLTMVEEPVASATKTKPPAEASPVTQRRSGARLPLLQRTGSLDTLSPCDSIASDDLMMDFEQSHSSGFDDSTDRLDSKSGSRIQSLDEPDTNDAALRDVRQEWSALLNKRHWKEGSPSLSTASGRSARMAQMRCRASEPFAATSTATGGGTLVPDSPRSLDGSRSRVASTSSASHSPLRLSRRYLPSTNSSSPTSQFAYDSDDSVRVDRAVHGSMMQDMVGIKTMLLKLKRVLQEPDEDLLMRSETLNPFESPMKNGHFNAGVAASQSGDGSVGGGIPVDRFELADLRRQVVFLQAQLEDRERTVQQLRQQVADVATSSSAPTSICESAAEMCNAATQTDRIRPMSAGPSLLQTFPSDAAKGAGPLVSMNEPPVMKRQHRRPPSLVEYRPSHLPTCDSPPSNLLRVFSKKSTETCLANRISRPASPNPPTSASSIPTRRSHSHSRIRITNTHFL